MSESTLPARRLISAAESCEDDCFPVRTTSTKPATSTAPAAGAEPAPAPARAGGADTGGAGAGGAGYVFKRATLDEHHTGRT